MTWSTRMITWGTLSCLLLASLPAGAGEDRLFPYETMKIVYELTGVQTGKKIWMMKDYGHVQIERTDIVSHAGGKDKVTKRVVLTTGDHVDTVDLVTNSGTRRRFPQLTRPLPEPPADAETKTIAGKTCRVHKLKRGWECIWKGYSLGLSANLGATQIEQIAIEVVPDAKLSDPAFAMPQVELHEVHPKLSDVENE